jgi:hypothetical protein
MPVIPAIQEVKTRRIKDKLSRLHLNKYSGYGGAHP